MLHNMRVLGKAGKNRGRGKRPVVRGVAMNPCDHPQVVVMVRHLHLLLRVAMR